MADEEKKPREEIEAPADQQDEAPQKDESRADSPNRLVKTLLNSKLIAVLLVLTVVINGAGLALRSLAGDKEAYEAEHDLGTYRFAADPSEKGRVLAAEFELHIALLGEIEKEARRRLAEKKHRVQQDVEELLRKAHGGDFDDPDLGELKRRLQARINETLNMKAISDVIITELKLNKAPPAAKPTSEISQSFPWIENSPD